MSSISFEMILLNKAYHTTFDLKYCKIYIRCTYNPKGYSVINIIDIHVDIN